MHCEIEFLAVGDGSRAGDAIIVRYGDVTNYKIMAVDGGTIDAGTAMVAHLKSEYGANVALEHIVLTHSDADHASGLRVVLKEIPVSNIWLHIPWLHAGDALASFKDKRWTKDGLAAAIKKEYDVISEIVDLALEKGCNIYYPFQGTQVGPFTILSPSYANYLNLLPQFDKTPEPDQQLLEKTGLWIGKPNLITRLLEKAAQKVENWVEESWGVELLRDNGVTSASNESSVVLYANLPNERILLTGDAGIKALSWAVQYARSRGFPLQNFSCVQIPHHGSRRNVGPSILNNLLGPIQPQGNARFSAYASAPADDDTHPRKIVLNAFMRRGGKVIVTQGRNKTYWGGFPPRSGYVPAEPVSFSTKVEAYDD